MIPIKKVQNSLIRWMPGLGVFFNYQKSWLKADFLAGFSVAAVALPSAIAYAQFMGISAIAGLYATILPLIVYALFGTSRQLIIGPDTATCVVIAAVIAPLAMDNPIFLWQLSIVVTLMIGFWCLIGSSFRLGILADLLSRPILVGLLTGVSLTLVVDQIAKLGGFSYLPTQNYLVERVIGLPSLLFTSHLPTLIASFVTFAILLLLKHYLPRSPASLIMLVILTFLSWLIGFEHFHIAILGEIPRDGLPLASWQDFHISWVRELVMPSLNIAVICFVSMMLAAQAFANRNRYSIDVNAEFRALGIANIVAGLSLGFAVSGTSSRTAVNDASGGKTQLVSIVAALVIALVVIFFLSLLQYIPIFVLGIILIHSSWSLIDFKTIFQFYSRNKQAFYLALFTLLCVLIIGIIPGIALAVLLGLLQFLRTIFRPTDQLLGLDENGIVRGLDGKANVKPIPEMVMYRFNSPLTYFNIGYFKQRILNIVERSETPIKWVVIDGVSCYTYPDVNVLIGTEELKRELEALNVQLILAGRKTELTRWFKEMRLSFAENITIVSDLYWAIRMLQSQNCASTEAENQP